MTNAISNVTQLTDKKPQPQAKFTFTATLDGFPITIEGEGRAGDLKIIIDRLKTIGAEPPVSANFRPCNWGTLLLSPSLRHGLR